MRHLIILAFFLLVSFQAHGLEGGVTSSGGDSVAAQFTQTARHIAEILGQEPQIGVSAESFLQAVNSTLVVSQDQVFLDGHERAAVNFPLEKKIIVGKFRWREIANQTGHRFALVMHEYLSVMGIDDTKYQISSKLFAVYGNKKAEIICDVFDDVFKLTGIRYKLHYILYTGAEMGVLMTDQGQLPGEPLGRTLVSAIKLPEGGSALLLVVNFGVIRNIQIPFPEGRLPLGKVIATTWDTKAYGQTSESTQTECTAQKW